MCLYQCICANVFLICFQCLFFPHTYLFWLSQSSSLAIQLRVMPSLSLFLYNKFFFMSAILEVHHEDHLSRILPSTNISVVQTFKRHLSFLPIILWCYWSYLFFLMLFTLALSSYSYYLYIFLVSVSNGLCQVLFPMVCFRSSSTSQSSTCSSVVMYSFNLVPRAIFIEIL